MSDTSESEMSGTEHDHGDAEMTKHEISYDNWQNIRPSNIKRQENISCLMSFKVLEVDSIHNKV